MNAEHVVRRTIAEEAWLCSDRFYDGLEALDKGDSQSAWAQLRDQFGRFNVWAANIGVFAKGIHATMDYRLRDLPVARDLVVDNLDIIAHRLWQLQPSREKSTKFAANSNHDVNLPETSSSRPSELSADDIQENIRVISDYISWLYKLSNTIRQASSIRQNLKATIAPMDDAEKATWENMFSSWVRREFPEITSQLCGRLAQSMLLRRRRVLYRRSRLEKLKLAPSAGHPGKRVAQPISKPDGASNETHIVPPEGNRSGVLTQPQAPKDMISDYTATTIDPEAYWKALRPPSRPSEVRTLALSKHGKLMVPRPPNVDGKLEFNCPYCCLVRPAEEAENRNKWAEHVKKDSEPYFCLFEDCENAEATFTASKEWISHMRTQHLMRWRCVAKAHAPIAFDNPTEYIAHMKSKHPHRFEDEQLRFMTESGGRAIGPTFTICPFCGKEEDDLDDHVKHHLHYVALRSLPFPDDYDSEFYGDSGSSLSSGHSVDRSSTRNNCDTHMPLPDFTDLPASDPSRPYDRSISEYRVDHAVDSQIKSIRCDTWYSVRKIRESHLPVELGEQASDPVLQSFLRRQSTSPRVKKDGEDPPRLGGCKYETARTNSRRRVPYSVGSDCLEKLDLRVVKNELTEEEEKVLAADIQEVFERLLPTDAIQENRKKLLLKLEKIFNNEWPGHDIKVHLFGSSGNLLCSDDSNVDISITTPWRKLEDVCMIANLLANRGMEKVFCISAAKVPIVKIWDPELGLECDMNVNNTLALENTRMVRTYVKIDPRVRKLAMIIKYWTRRRIINDAALGGTISSYTWICLIIAFLQLRDPPVLPSLHQSPYKLNKPDGTKSDFADDITKLDGYGSKNKASVATLLFQFFRFYAYEFDYDKYELSVRIGKLRPRTDQKWHNAINNKLCVEEPFNISRNLGNTIDEFSFRGLHMELRRAFDLISVAKFEEACEQYVFPKEERVWSRQPPQYRPRPVLLRSSSQVSSGRGGRGNRRGGRRDNFHQNNANRVASSSVPTYDIRGMFIQQASMPQEAQWYENSQFQFQYAPQDVMAQTAYYQAQIQQQLHHATFMQNQVISQQQGMSKNATSEQQHNSDTSWTNSFDDAPLSVPLSPDMHTLYGMGPGSSVFPQAGAADGPYPSSTVTATGDGNQDSGRPPHGSLVTDKKGVSASSSSLRSHSQPASRSASTSRPAGGQLGSRVSANAPSKNGVPIPSFIAYDVDVDEI